MIPECRFCNEPMTDDNREGPNGICWKCHVKMRRGGPELKELVLKLIEKFEQVVWGESSEQPQQADCGTTPGESPDADPNG